MTLHQKHQALSPPQSRLVRGGASFSTAVLLLADMLVSDRRLAIAPSLYASQQLKHRKFSLCCHVSLLLLN